MKTRNQLFAIILLTVLIYPGYGQALKPGFNKQEYIEMMHISARVVKDSAYYNQFPEPKGYCEIYQSPVMGLDNAWDLWLGNDGKAVISLRGTTIKPESWLENFYAAMVPARGEIQLSSKENLYLSAH